MGTTASSTNSEDYDYDYDAEKTISGVFSRIHSSGSADVDVSSDEKEVHHLQSDNNIKASISSGTLEIETENTGGGGGGAFINFGMESIISSGSGQVSVSSPNIKDVKVNGRKVVYADEVANVKKKSEYCKSWRIIRTRSEEKKSVNFIDVSGSGSLRFRHDIFLPQLTCRVSGSGSLKFPSLSIFDNVKAHVSGSGSVSFEHSTIASLYANVSSSGSICNFYASRLANAKVSGSGSIYGRRAEGSNLSKSVSGSGSINIKV
jgi:hypothetical protein